MKPMYINGQWLTASDGETIDVFNPATETVLDSVPNGNARELGEEGLESFLETKHVHWDFDDKAKDFWYPY